MKQATSKGLDWTKLWYLRRRGEVVGANDLVGVDDVIVVVVGIVFRR